LEAPFPFRRYGYPLLQFGGFIRLVMSTKT
jgi:hypothetical protein